MTKLYQNIPLEGVQWQNENRLESKYWNEGKWNNFIAPLLPEDCKEQVFVDMGCNAGLFLKLAEDRGFDKIVGVEKDKTPVEEGIKYRDSIGYCYTILKRSLGTQFGGKGNFDIEELPVTDFTVMSTFHYYIPINTWLKYVDALKGKTKNVLIVTRPVMKKQHWKAMYHIDNLRRYFKGWEEVGLIDNIKWDDNDPSPRNLLTVMFKNPIIDRIPIKDIDIREPEKDSMYKAMMDLAETVSKNPAANPLETPYYDKWVQRKKAVWSERFIRKFVRDKFNLLVDVMENGLKDPIVVEQNNRLCDGGHRLAILKALGYKTALVRRTIV